MSEGRLQPSELATAAGRVYRILHRAGAGEAGEVFHAIDVATGVEVALKCARSTASLASLAREAGYAALALSPLLPELHDVGWLASESEGAAPARGFVALRWVAGELLDRRTHASRPPVEAIGRGLALALSDLHAAGIAHGDLKPANVLIDGAGRAHLLDLGLASRAHTRSIEGATPRYLARGDADLGDARARDLLALGVILAELADEEEASSSDPVGRARATTFAGELGSVVPALLAPSPGARASAAWVAEMLRASGPREDEGAAQARAVRAAYLRVRRDALATGGRIGDDVAPWVAEARRWHSEIRSLAEGAASVGPATDPAVDLDRVIGPMTLEEIARWLTALVGTPATEWPVALLPRVPEPVLARSLTELARTRRPLAWTFGDVERALAGAMAVASPELLVPSVDASVASRVALGLARVPADTRAIAAVEQDADAPEPLVAACADALRLSGELGRSRALVLRAEARGVDVPRGLVADVLRRAGDLALAERVARGAASHDPRARAVLARLLLDRGEIAAAEEAARGADGPGPLASEVLALVASARGDALAALEWVGRGEALATEPEERARLAGARGYVVFAADPGAARAAFTVAVEHAARAGAIVEEATYRTGEGAAAVDLGDVGVGIATARRAALLWEHLGRPSQAARALLAVAAAQSTVGAAHDASVVAERSAALAREAGDARAEVYALWVVADVSAPGSDRGCDAADRALAILHRSAPIDREDELRASARALRHGTLRLGRLAELDVVAAGGALAAGREAAISPAARLDWWGARALAGTGAPRSADVLGAILGLADAPGSLGARARALAAGHELATQSGRGEAAQRLLSVLAELAQRLLASAPAELRESVRALPWVERAGRSTDGLGAAQARDLEALIRGLGDRLRLSPILNRIVDALVLWTGVERGVLLMRAPDGKLVPRAARNLARSDLVGEQLLLSESLARRALAAREPVVAVDASGELGDLHASVHALKLRSVLAVPLITRGETLGVAYLDDRVRRGAFGQREIEWARTIASLAAMVIADARDQVLLRRAARRARRASEEIAATLSLREAALDAAEREIIRARVGRDTRFPYAAIVGESRPIRAMLALVDRVTASEIAVLISGESGSGKELVARAIHDNGARRARPFVTENCGAVPESLLESELFGHVRGAFTGADRPRAGLFDVADGGTLFLDEIGEMSIGMQTKLLRVLEDGIVRPVGSDHGRSVDVRVIAATNRDLAAMVRERAFREDLFYRLEIISIRVPSLRERPEDIPLLVQHFVDTLSKREPARDGVRVTSAAMDRLVAYPWPGNVRQLQNEVRRALVLSDGVIDEEHLSPELVSARTAAPRETGLHLRTRTDQLERRLITEAMERTGQNQTQAAKLLGLSRFGLQKMLKRLAIE